MVLSMNPLHATVTAAECRDDQYRLSIELIPSEFPGPFEHLRFKKNPYSGSFSHRAGRTWLTLIYRKNPGFGPGDAFPLWRARQKPSF
jgi:hypothetical protein